VENAAIKKMQGVDPKHVPNAGLQRKGSRRRNDFDPNWMNLNRKGREQ
jgi:hypothetical protein